MSGQMIGVLVSIVGLGIAFLGWWSCMREMFEESRGYGYLAFLFPLLPLIYAALHWDDLKRQFWFQAVGLALFGAGTAIRMMSQGS